MAKNTCGTSSFLMFMLAAQAIVCVVLVLDIPIARQVLSFLYLLLVPGFMLLKGFRLKNCDISETILFSVGLSISFLMFVGVLINELGLLNLISNPLSTEHLAVIINLILILMCVLFFLNTKEESNETTFKGLRTFLIIASYLILPFLGITGVMLAKAFQNNFFLLAILAAISILFLIIPFYPKFSSYYPLLLVSIAFTLSSSISLASNYIYGHDIHLEFFLFKETKNISYWNKYIAALPTSMLYNSYNAMLSITILPTIFSNILNMEEIWTFKILYTVILSLVPLALYKLHEIQWGKKIAFLSALFYMSNTVFFEFWNSAKQTVGDLFVLLLFLALFKKDMNNQTRWMFLMCLGFGLIVSYYTMNYIFLILLSLTWLCTKIFSKNRNTKIKSTIPAFFLVLTFLWYVFVVHGPFMRLEHLFTATLRNFFEELFNPLSRGRAVLTAAGVLPSPSFLHFIGRILHNITELFILIGFIALLVNIKKEKLEPEYFILTSINMVLLIIATITPFSTNVFKLERLYHIVLLFSSPLFILGGKALFENISKIMPLREEKRKECYSTMLILILLVAFFLFQTGFIYEIAGDPNPTSISLSRYKMDDYKLLQLGLVHESDFFGATWLSRFGDMENTQIYSDVRAKFYVLTSCAINGYDRIIVLSNTTKFANGAYIYLSRYNTLNEVLLYDDRWPKNIRYNMSEIPIFNGTAVFNNKVYSNAATEIYYYAP